MAKHIGIVACSAEGAALCYRTICVEAPKLMGEYGHPEVTVHTQPLSEYMIHIRAGAWGKVAELMLSSVRKLAQAGAELAICPDNTIHQAYDLVVEKSPIPWLHIAEVVAQEAKHPGFHNLATAEEMSGASGPSPALRSVRNGAPGYQRLGITGTKYLMTGSVYPEALEKFDIAFDIPDAEDREAINQIIFTQLVHGDVREDSRRYFNAVIQKLKDNGCDAVVLGCTEIPLLVDPEDCPLPTLDSTRLLARAAIRTSVC